MKKIGKLKLNQLSNAELEKREMGNLVGGTGDCSGDCACGCDGSSSTSSNRNANNSTYTPYSGFDREDGFWDDCNWS